MALNIILTCLVVLAALNLLLIIDLYNRSAKLAQFAVGAVAAITFVEQPRPLQPKDN
jgi:hypothetical protein